MISTELARALQDSGLGWRPASGDAFRIDRPEVDADVFTVSEMTVEAHEHPTGTVLGFNQLRELLRGTFRGLQRATDTEDGEPVYRVEAVIAGTTMSFTGSDAADAYGRALLSLIDLSSASPVDDQAAGVPWPS